MLGEGLDCFLDPVVFGHDMSQAASHFLGKVRVSEGLWQGLEGDIPKGFHIQAAGGIMAGGAPFCIFT